jgi:hypothetical protein
MVSLSGKHPPSLFGRRTKHVSNSKTRSRSLSLCIFCGMVTMMLVYVFLMISFVRYAHLPKTVPSFENAKPPATPFDEIVKRQVPREDWGDKQKGKPQFRQDWGHGVEPQILVPPPPPQRQERSHSTHADTDTDTDTDTVRQQHHRRVLTAYLEPIDQSTWDTKPLPIRTYTAKDLDSIQYPKLTKCSKLPEQWPVDEYPHADPFLPWIHDVFPTADGKFIQFIAQNKRRCQTGSTHHDEIILKKMQPQASLFQHVAVKRISSAGEHDNTNTNSNSNSNSNTNSNTNTNTNTTRYRLASHQDADPDGMVTRFICRFQPSGEETLSVSNVNYEWASFRKKHKHMFTPPGQDNKFLHTTQLIFKCPVPLGLQAVIRSGASVVEDYASLFVDVVPIRTPPRYGPPNAFLPPYYEEFQLQSPVEDVFDARQEWGDHHVLPLIQDSGRWENIPICKPTLQTYPQDDNDKSKSKQEEGDASPLGANAAIASDEGVSHLPEKKHRLISCLWASTGYATRGNRFAINDGQRRLLEWISYNKLIGVEHFYVYDNSGAFLDSNSNSNSNSNSTQSSLQPIADLFPDDVTLIRWPSKVCNNNPNNVDSVGERSSQYAAESSCRLRFGPHTDWIIQLDIGT